MHKNTVVAILGASGFIGKRLVEELRLQGLYEIRVMSRAGGRRDPTRAHFGDEVEIYEGDVSDVDSLRKFFVPGCIVVNLVYFWTEGAEENLKCARALVEACRDIKVARLVHCSTADVVGRVAKHMVDERTQCNPISDYGKTKWEVEKIISQNSKDYFDAVILRPTSVLGIDGLPLKKLVGNLSTGPAWKNYLKSCLFNTRRMNLVPLANVVAAIIFVSFYEKTFDGGVFIVANDDDSRNNFKDVEDFCMKNLGVKKYVLPRLPVPLPVLKFLLLVLGRSNIDPYRNFNSEKLQKLGFARPLSLDAGLSEYIAWYKQAVLGK